MLRPMPRPSDIVLAAIAIVFLAAPVFAQEQPPEGLNLPVHRVALFTSGVGYFEHSGTVHGQGVATLRFQTDQINDVLKSLVVADPSGQVEFVTYPSREPLERKLKSYAIDLSDNPSLPDLLDRLRGVEIFVQAATTMQGRIVGVDSRQSLSQNGQVLTTQYLLKLLTERGMVAIPLDSIGSIELIDKALDKEFREALGLLAGSHETQLKPLEIRFGGKEDRTVAVGYVAAAPVWKTSYRLVLHTDKPATLLGWGIVENTTDTDWDNVQLELIAGRPISFIEDLYTPLFVNRPVVRPELYANLQPQTYEQGMPLAARRAEADQVAKAAGGMLMEMAAGRTGAMAPAAAPMPSAVAGIEQQQTIAAGAEVGQLFRYKVDVPVTLPRQRSAMLPILSAAVPAESVSIYNQSVLAKHPLRGAKLKNDSGLVLLAGPITVYEDQTYAGDAQIETLSAGQERLISYAVDLDVAVDPSQQSTASVFGASLNKGVLTVHHREVAKQTYAIKNSSDKDRALIVEHPRQADWELTEPKEAAETTPEFYRFRQTVAAEATSALTVQTQHTFDSTVVLVSLPVDQILVYSRDGEIPPKVRDALAKAAQLKQQVEQVQADIARVTKQRDQITADQQRLRQNLQAVSQDTDLGRRYLAKLSEQEGQMDALTRQLSDLQDQLTKAQQDLSDYLNGLNIE